MRYAKIHSPRSTTPRVPMMKYAPPPSAHSSAVIDDLAPAPSPPLNCKSEQAHDGPRSLRTPQQTSTAHGLFGPHRRVLQPERSPDPACPAARTLRTCASPRLDTRRTPRALMKARSLHGDRADESRRYTQTPYSSPSINLGGTRGEQLPTGPHSSATSSTTHGR